MKNEADVRKRARASAKISKKEMLISKETAAKSAVSKGLTTRKHTINKTKSSSSSGKLLAKPWPVKRIRDVMRLWNMTQAEFAVFCGVSYDTVTSWSRGRRNLVRVSHAEHLKKAEQSAKKRKLTEKSTNPWTAAGKVIAADRSYSKLKAFKYPPVGSFKIAAVETAPGSLRRADEFEMLKLGRAKTASNSVPVHIIVNDLEITLTGKWRKLGDKRLLELSAPVDDPAFISGRAGCIVPVGGFLRISLWSSYPQIPIHFLAVQI